MATLAYKRNKTAKELAEKLDVSPRTIQRMIAEPREEYLVRSQEKSQNVIELRTQGLKIKEIADQLQMPAGTVGTILSKAKKSGKLSIIYHAT